MRKSNLKKWRNFLLRVLDLNKKKSSLVQIATPKMPRAKLRMYRHTTMPSFEKAATSTQSPSSPTRSNTSKKVIYNPLPPKDQGFE
jgi:hypothetical protein